CRASTSAAPTTTPRTRRARSATSRSDERIARRLAPSLLAPAAARLRRLPRDAVRRELLAGPVVAGGALLPEQLGPGRRVARDTAPGEQRPALAAALVPDAARLI